MSKTCVVFSRLLWDIGYTCEMAISNALGSNAKGKSIFNSPLLFVGLGPQALLDSDSLRSPTSPLEVSVLSNLGNNPLRTSPDEGQQRSWDCTKVGLSIIDSLEDCSKISGNILLSSDRKNSNLSPQMITKTPNGKSFVDSVSVQASKSLPKDFFKLPYTQNSSNFHKGESTVLFEIGETLQEHEPFGKSMSYSLDSCSPIKDLSGLSLTRSKHDSESGNFALNPVCSPPHFIGGSKNQNTLKPVFASSSSNEFIKCVSASEVEDSEDYTCVISHGPNPKTTHIFCDCILEIHADDPKKHHKIEEKEGLCPPVFDILETPNQYHPSGDFLSFCHLCNKKLEEGKDIYIYR